jgi:hypothetical protein
MIFQRGVASRFLHRILFFWTCPCAVPCDVMCVVCVCVCVCVRERERERENVFVCVCVWCVYVCVCVLFGLYMYLILERPIWDSVLIQVHITRVRVLYVDSILHIILLGSNHFKKRHR